MAYTVGITIFDFNSPPVYPAGTPALTGRLAVPQQGAPASATSGGTPTALSFSAAASPPAAPGTLLVTDPTGPGDLFRSGPVLRWPAEPAFITAYLLPLTPTAALPGFPGVGRFSYAALGALVAPSLPIVIEVPWYVTAVCTIVSAFQFNPAKIWITSVTFTPSPTGPGVIRAVFGGFVDDFGGSNGINFGGSIDLTPTPSGDAANPRRILAIATSNLAINLDPAAAKAAWAVVAVLARLFAEALSGPIGDRVNGAIAASVAGVNVASVAPGLSETWTISARRITVAASGITVQVVASDLPRPRPLMASVEPPPHASTAVVHYVVTVTDVVTGAPVAGATVTWQNFTSAGAPATVRATTDGNGQASFDVALRARRTQTTVDADGGGTRPDGKPERERPPFTRGIVEHPMMTVTAAGYVDVTRPLF